MKKNLILASILLSQSLAFAGSQADYQAGLDFTANPTGGVAGGQNASNINNLVNIFLMNQTLDQLSGSSANTTLNNTSQSAQDVNVLRQYFSQSNSPAATTAMGLNAPGGRGDQKKQFCTDYVNKAKTPNPDPAIYAECQGVVELNGQRIRDYRAASGFSAADSIFSSSTQVGLAKQTIAAAPQAQLLKTVGVGTTSTTTGGTNCVTQNLVGPPQTTTGHCARAATPTAITCGNTITPQVILEKFCNASGGPTAVASSISSSGSGNTYTDPVTGAVTGPSASIFTHAEPFYLSNLSGPVQIEYTCGTPSAIDGSITTIIARISVPAGTYPNEQGPVAPVSMEFAPGVTHPWALGSLGYHWWQTCVAFGAGCNGNIINYNYAMEYDGPTDNVHVRYLGQSRDGAPETAGDTIASCAPGTNFIPASAPYQNTTCTTTNLFLGPVCTTSTFYGVPSRCETPGMTSSFAFGPTIVTSPGSCWTDINGNYTCGCPTTGLPGPSGLLTAPTCYTATYPAGCPAAPPGDAWLSVLPVPTTNPATGIPVFPPMDCTLKSAVDNLKLYTIAPHYLGGAGIRERLVEVVADTCAPLQAQATPGPAITGGSYPPTVSTQNTCPANWTLQPASATFPAACQYQPADVPATGSVTFTCPNGGTYNATTLMCELQNASYAAFASQLYTCPVGDTVKGGVCPNNGAKTGETCLYKPYLASITSQTCPAGFTLYGSLCYNNPALTTTINVANGTSVINSAKTYACTAPDVLNGTLCMPAAQSVMCENQPASVPSAPLNHYTCPASNTSGGYVISYTMPNNTIQANGCIANQLTKTATMLNRFCDAPYAYNAKTDKCEYQMPDYASTAKIGCTDPTYTYDPITRLCEKSAPIYNAF